MCTESFNKVQPAVEGTGTSVSDLNVMPDDVWTCTFTNELRQGTLIVEKVLPNDNGGDAACEDFSFTVDGGTAIQFDADPDCSNSLTVRRRHLRGRGGRRADRWLCHHVCLRPVGDLPRL